MPELSAPDGLVVPNDFFDDEGQELLGELRIEIGVDGELAKPLDLPLLACRVCGREVVRSLQPADLLGVLEPLGEHVNQCGIDVVDARANLLELGPGCVVGVHGPRFYGTRETG